MAFQREYFPEGFPPNIWPGVTVEHQEAAEARLEILCGLNVQIGGVRWVSMEPLLERVNIRPWLPQHEAARRACTRIGWVVAGCESSGPRPGERHTSLDWVRQAQEECAQAGVPLYVKQLVVNEQLVKEPAGWPQDFPCLS
jgi:protein gp37